MARDRLERRVKALDVELESLTALLNGLAGSIRDLTRGGSGLDPEELSRLPNFQTRCRTKLKAVKQELAATDVDDRNTGAAIRPSQKKRRRDIEARVDLIQMTMKIWPAMMRFCERVANETGHPLYMDRPIFHPFTLRGGVTDRLFVILDRQLSSTSQSEAALEHGCYDDITLPMSQFLDHVHAARRAAIAMGKITNMRFLDVGCGAGVKVLAARQFFDRSDGLEFDLGFAEKARRLTESENLSAVKIITGDALKFDDYSAYDIIYFYKPMKDTEKLIALEQRIARLAAPGAILIAPYFEYLHRMEELGVARVSGSVFIKGITQSEADVVHDRAIRIGLALPDTRIEFARLGLWAPVVSALSDTGHLGNTV